MVRNIIVLLGVLFIGWGANTHPAHAQTPCGDRNQALVKLSEGYSEAPVALGLASNGSVVELFTSNSGTFTIIMTHPSGVSCLMISGESWETLPTRLAGARS